MTVVELAVDDASGSVAAYRRFFGRDAAAFQYDTTNAAVRLDGARSTHRVLFGVDDVASWQTLLQRRGLEVHSSDAVTVGVDGLPVGVTEDRTPRAHDGAGADDILGIDHLVFQAAGRDHAVALFGASLGLDFRLDRPVSDGLRQLFFRADDLIIEVLVTPEDTSSVMPTDSAMASRPLSPEVSLWGIAWATGDIEVTHARLVAAGFTVSRVRSGRKPDTRVATVRAPALATRTLIIEPTQPVAAKRAHG